MSIRQLATDWGRSLAAPVAFAMAAGLGWSLYDVFHLLPSEQSDALPLWRAWAQAAAVATVVALVVAPIAALIPPAIKRFTGDNPQRLFAPLTTAALALAALGITTFAAQHGIYGLFSSDMVRLIATSAIVPLAAAGIGAAAWRCSPLVERALSRLSPQQTRIAVVALPVALALAAVSILPVVAPSVWEQLDPQVYLAIPVIGAAAVAGSFVASRSLLVRIAAVPALATVVLAVTHVATPTPDALRKSLDLRPSGTAFVLGLAPDFSASTRRHSTARAGGASCYPDIDPLPADQIGDVDEGAPDIIFITVDALRWDHTTLSGYPHETTPNIGSYAPEAVVFEQAYSPASNTRQSFRGFFTGVYPSLVESPPSTPWGTSFADDQETMAGYLSAAGYQTIALSSRDKAFPAQHGALNGFEVIDETPIPLEKQQGHSVSYKVDRIISHLSEPGEERPRFVWTHLMETHQPYPSGPDPKRFSTGRYRNYDSAAHFVDGELGRLLDFARGPMRRENTVVVITADHGQAFQEHDNRLHGATVYQEEIHVPMIVWGPDVDARRIDAPVSGVDILPTLLGWLNLEVPEAMCGADLTAVLQGQSPPEDRPVYVENIPDATRDYFGVAFVDGTEKLIVYPSSQVAELYDLSRDPDERSDLAGERDRLDEAVRKLRDFYSQRGIDPDFYGLDDLRSAEGGEE